MWVKGGGRGVGSGGSLFVISIVCGGLGGWVLGRVIVSFARFGDFPVIAEELQ